MDTERDSDFSRSGSHPTGTRSIRRRASGLHSSGGAAASGRRDRRGEIIRGLRERTSATVAELADHLGVHPNTIRFHLGVLERDGDVVREQQTTSTPGRPELRFRLSPGRDSAPDRVELLGHVLLAHIAAADDPVAEAQAAGRIWGRCEAHEKTGGGSDAVDDLVCMLDTAGFAPVQRGHDVINLLSCPLRQFLGTHGRLVCAIHHGIMAGYLEGSTSQMTVDTLEPFATTTSCRTRLRAN